MNSYHADFHVHIGRSLGKPVKIAAGSKLTLDNLLYHSAFVKGLDVVTVIDGVCDNVLTEVKQKMDQGDLIPVNGGGLMYRDRLLVILGSEIELAGPHGGAAHFGCWFPDVESASDFNTWLQTVQKNTSLSSQRARTDAATLLEETHTRGGLFVIHHAFTPFKGILGRCVSRIEDFLDPALVDALELGLSADTLMADRLSELANFTFITNSDAHGLDNIAREYNRISMKRPSFNEVRAVLHSVNGRRVEANYGLHPQQGKYYRTRCRHCDTVVSSADDTCLCGNDKGHVYGVWDRLEEISDLAAAVHPKHRPPYIHHVPLRDIPGLGPRGYQKLMAAFGTELAVRQRATHSQLTDVLGEHMGQIVARALQGDFTWQVGGAGTYGKLVM
ncbi:endonuclease Q family protein [Alicyclobacillus dauci]|uniref:Endonuclease Q family protein n=1 Tax=Alicyclobacillus dauci TaxID=1475485 RepID=A0ABY6Z909_9BACL|nr:endonuclease Q family protein [Alicyclobacillus dauci]WAH39052.1 endonuclease Q family protein [Alicyclobacillus dauci]